MISRTYVGSGNVVWDFGCLWAIASTIRPHVWSRRIMECTSCRGGRTTKKARPGTLHLVPIAGRTDDLSRDYEQMADVLRRMPGFEQAHSIPQSVESRIKARRNKFRLLSGGDATGSRHPDSKNFKKFISSTLSAKKKITCLGLTKRGEIPRSEKDSLFYPRLTKILLACQYLPRDGLIPGLRVR